MLTGMPVDDMYKNKSKNREIVLISMFLLNNIDLFIDMFYNYTIN